MLPDLNTLLSYYEMGGFVMPPLLFVSILLWYSLAYRIFLNKVSRHTARTLVSQYQKQTLESTSVVACAVRAAFKETERATSQKHLKALIEEQFKEIRKGIGRYKGIVRSLVGIAPLLGLLGTVDGMIETFNSLGDMALFSQSGGIAGGISKALFTTQIGLVISIPGLLIGRIVERNQLNIERELDQVKDLVCSEKY